MSRHPENNNFFSEPAITFQTGSNHAQNITFGNPTSDNIIFDLGPQSGTKRKRKGRNKQIVISPESDFQPMMQQPTDSIPYNSNSSDAYNPSTHAFNDATTVHPTFGVEESNSDLFDVSNKKQYVSNSKSQQDYLREFVDHIELLLPATIAKEYRHPEMDRCHGCPGNNEGLWRCRDCLPSYVQCRACMRKAHLQNPFHRIECWTGTHYRHAALWEVGVYIEVPHHDFATHQKCTQLYWKVQQRMEFEQKMDADELQNATSAKNNKRSGNQGDRGQKTDSDLADTDIEMMDADCVADDLLHMDGSDEEDDQPLSAAEERHREAIFDRDLDAAYRKYGFFKASRPQRSDDEESLNEQDRPTPRASERTEPDVRQPSTLKRVIHTNGYHRIRIISCSCRGPDHNVQDLVAVGLMPASFHNIRTLFTRQLLEFTRLANLELYASAYQVKELLSRMTQSLGWSMTDNIYHEFRRMLRIDRWLKKLKWSGFCHHGDPRKPLPAEFGIFCATCPQPGVNLPDDWEEDAGNSIYGRTFVADGNFKADHIAHASGGDDVALYDGAGMIPNSEQYKNYIETVEEERTKASCENTFRAIESAMAASKACDITGVVGVACARHSCYAPGGLTDLFRGEQQKNVDYAFVQALANTNVNVKQKVTIVYDIACQYYIHLRKRIDPLLATIGLKGLVIDRAIGLFHVHAHKDECFFRYSPTFIPGLAYVVGEGMEPNWSALNPASVMIRSSKPFARADFLDDHTSNHNFRKMMNMSQTLTQMLADAEREHAHHEKVFLKVSASASSYTKEWSAQIEEAERKRMEDPTVMDIYGADAMKTGLHHPPSAALNSPSTQIDIYFTFALMVEEKQQRLLTLVKKVGQNPTDPQSKQIDHDRQELWSLLPKLRILEHNAQLVSMSDIQHIDPEQEANSLLPENHLILCPSNNNVPMDSAPHELRMRIHYAAVHLNRIRELVVDKSLQYSHVVRGQPSKALVTRSRGKIQDLASELDLEARLYRQTRQRLVALGADADTLTVYRELSPKDTAASTLILSPNERGSTKVADTLSWIWLSRIAARGSTASMANTAADPIAQKECISRALYHRWREEHALVRNEMNWTVRYFLKKGGYWEDAAALPTISLPAAAYARRKAAAWLRLATQADIAFRSSCTEYTSPM
ncbi:hypothetical protein CVT24_002518 [Panaeolus cyanescens]|uniref:CxC2-like cysteine cluster KDZ transposase-associated domain-containing protein n=1 Tax=Panaeolus cyanescens TaxID=181874 RepID=A0A409YTL8_9AGAR|nr:hypothetical protein CVT24_002518 [Panaeolus cyanescens]